MEDYDRLWAQTFLDKWQCSQGNERANYQGFFLDFYDALGVDHPPLKGNIAGYKGAARILAKVYYILLTHLTKYLTLLTYTIIDHNLLNY